MKNARLFIGFGMCAIIVLLALGTWQMERLKWKRDVLNSVDHAKQEPPVELSNFETLDENWDYRRVRVTGHYMHEHNVFLQSRIHNRDIGTHVLTPFKTDDERIILVNRGFVPNAHNGIFNQPEGVQNIVGALHIPDDHNMFTPDNVKGSEKLYWTDLSFISAETHLTLETPFVLYLDSTDVDGAAEVYPLGGQLRVDIPNNHLEYAIFWYAMAFVLAIIMVLRMRRERKENDTKL